MAGQPTGTVTHLFTDVEGSTGLWEEQPEAMQAALARHDAILREAIQAQAGHVVKSTGDGFRAVFPTAPAALAAALAAQQALQAEPWSKAIIEVRMGLHSGAAEERDSDYLAVLILSTAQLQILQDVHSLPQFSGSVGKRRET
jgi:class 3 adenylate cyclase